MNSYILALSIIAIGIFIHHVAFSSKEGLTNKDSSTDAAAAAVAKEKAAEEAAEAKWEGTVNWYTTQFTNFLDLAKKQEAMVSNLEANEKAYKQILSCLTYREKQMNAAIEQRRGARQSQKAEGKSNLKNALNSVQV